MAWHVCDNLYPHLKDKRMLKCHSNLTNFIHVRKAWLVEGFVLFKPFMCKCYFHKTVSSTKCHFNGCLGGVFVGSDCYNCRCYVAFLPSTLHMNGLWKKSFTMSPAYRTREMSSVRIGSFPNCCSREKRALKML